LGVFFFDGIGLNGVKLKICGGGLEAGRRGIELSQHGTKILAGARHLRRYQEESDQKSECELANTFHWYV